MDKVPIPEWVWDHPLIRELEEARATNHAHLILARFLQQTLWAALAFAGVYGGLYVALQARRRRDRAYREAHSEDQCEEFANRSASTLNAFGACYGVWAFWRDEWAMITHPVFHAVGGSPAREYYMALLLGYLLFDLLRILYWRFGRRMPQRTQGSTSMIIHHLIVFGIFATGVAMQAGTYFMMLFMSNEITTPILNLRFFLTFYQKRQSTWYLLNELLFVVGFFVFRIVINLGFFSDIVRYWHIYREGMARYGHGLPVMYFLVILVSSHILLQMWWFTLILRTAYRRMVRPGSSPTAATHPDATRSPADAKRD
ncbi:hypothetical protein CXG81DRAFT_26748 [Caulochytrium protostelioides]|nr:hypothetical protein CXG81DRAFT_26748 [Caulochytrium protostelioides]|eukprot:RKP00565.1 hypothetical protein CXG81DRAFT_26748 [Caulochytrium protostelioides]